MSITREAVEDSLRAIIDPDLGADIVSLGFVKSVEIDGSQVKLDLELTTPACPVRDQFRSAAEQCIAALPGVESVQVTLSSRQQERPVGAERSGLDGVESIIAVASGKGGVGKSTVAAAIAVELSRQGHRVGLLDLDIYGPSVPTLFEHHDVGLAGNEQNMVLPELFGDLKVMSFGFWLGDQPAIMRGPMVSNYIQQFLHQVQWGDLDYLILDLPPGTGDVQLTITQSARLDGAVIITTPHVLSAADVGKAIQMFDKVAVPILGIVENMSYFVAPDTGATYHVFGSGAAQRISERFGPPILGQLPISPEQFGGPVQSSARSEALQSVVEATVRNLGRSKAGLDAPQISHNDDSVTLTWKGGESVTIDHRALRASCQCALCVDEFSGDPLLDPSSLPDDIHPEQIGTVGNYALSIQWSDGHTTGFFPYARIRQIGSSA